MGNPHVVVSLPSPAELADLDLSAPPAVRPALPEGQNVEFVVRLGPRHLAMRVHERGVGETRSCGTGICAAAVAVAQADGIGPDGQPWRVDVPGGSCEVVWHPDGEVELIGPAVLVADIDVDDEWLRGR
jgi:diaminopimelate epimerase